MQTRDDLEQVIRDGGSVLRHGKIITDIDQLPSDEELAGDYPERKDEVAAASKANQAAKAVKDAKD